MVNGISSLEIPNKLCGNHFFLGRTKNNSKNNLQNMLNVAMKKLLCDILLPEKKKKAASCERHKFETDWMVF